MSSICFLLVALWLCSLPAFAQDHSVIAGNTGSNVQQVPDFHASAATTSEPWRILPKPDNVQQVPDFRPQAATASEPWRILPKPGSDKDKGLMVITVSPDGLLAEGTTCYVIGSYVVARDSKDSDSVHPVGYSSCIPATRYRLKTADDHVAR